MLSRPSSTSLLSRSDRSGKRSIALATSILVLAVLLAYSGSLNAPFVYDDILAIKENETIRQLWPLSPVLWPQVEGGLTVSGRPILNLSFALNHAISGTNVWSYHVFNVLLHAASALLLFSVARRTFHQSAAMQLPRPGTSASPNEGARGESLLLGFALSAVWALHPLLTQAVTYTVQRAESLMGFFFLLTFHAFIRGTDFQSDQNSRTRSRCWLGVSVLACVLGMATKEVMATAPLMILLYDRTFLAGSFRAAWRARRGYHLTLMATWLVLGCLVLSTGGNRGGTVGIGTGIALWAYPLTQFEAVVRYVGLALWPHPLVFEYGTFWASDMTSVLPYVPIVGLLLAGTIVALARWPKAGFCGCWFFLILAPTSLAPGTIQMIVEHRMYLPLIGLMALVVVAVHRCLGVNALVVALAATIPLGLLTYRRNHDYRTHLTLWADTVAKRPHNPRAHDGLAEAYLELGQVNEALSHRREAVRLLPGESRYHYNLALTLSIAGRRDEAVLHYQQALQLTPNEARTHNNLAILLGETGDTNAALRHYAEAVRIQPNDALFRYNQGVAQMRAGRYAEAAASLETALRLRRDYSDAHFNLATTLVRLGRTDDAFAHYNEALRLKPEDVQYRTTYGGALLVARRPSEALVQFQHVLANRPESIEALFGAGNALAAERRASEAIVHYETVLRHAPDHAGAHFKLANVLLDVDRVQNAVEHYAAALQLMPQDAEAHHNLGVAYARLEKWHDAQREFETALHLKPDYADARRNLDQLKTLLRW